MKPDGHGLRTLAAVLWSDRHADPSIHLFSKPAAAIEWAKAKAIEHDRYGDLDEVLTDAMKKMGWIYYAAYSNEGDHIRVELVEVDKDIQ